MLLGYSWQTYDLIIYVDALCWQTKEIPTEFSCFVIKCLVPLSALFPLSRCSLFRLTIPPPTSYSSCRVFVSLPFFFSVFSLLLLFFSPPLFKISGPGRLGFPKKLEYPRKMHESGHQLPSKAYTYVRAYGLIH